MHVQLIIISLQILAMIHVLCVESVVQHVLLLLLARVVMLVSILMEAIALNVMGIVSVVHLQLIV